MINRKKLMCSIMLLMMSFFIMSGSMHLSAAERPMIKNITTDVNGSVIVEKIGPDETGVTTYRFEITPHPGYRIDEIIEYVSGIGIEKGAFSEINLIALEDGAGSTKILNLPNNSPIYSEERVKVSFTKIKQKAKLKLVPMEETTTFKDELRLKLVLEDENGKILNISKFGKVYLSFGNQHRSLGIFKKSEDNNRNGIDSNNIIRVKTDFFNGEGNFSLNSYYVDTKTGLTADGEKIDVRILKKAATMTLSDLIQTEGNVNPAKLVTVPYVAEAQVLYKSFQNGSELWTDKVPDRAGTYEVKAYIKDSPQFEDNEVFGTFVVKNSTEGIRRASSVKTSYDSNNFIEATINSDKSIGIKGTFSSCDTDTCRISIGNVNKTFQANKQINEVIDVRELAEGSYNLDITYYSTKTSEIYNNNTNELKLQSGFETVYCPKYSARYKVEVYGEEIYFSESKIFNENQKAYQEIMSKNPSSYLDKKIATTDKYIEIKNKAESITSGISSDYEKIRQIYMWISDNLYYDYDYYLKKIQSNHVPYEPISIFESQIAICSGYSRLANIMLQSIGIPTINVTGKAYEGNAFLYNDGKLYSENHEWNMAYSVDKGRWVIFDSTWNSMNRYENNQKIYKGLSYKYFDPTLEYFSYDHLFSTESNQSEIKPDFIDNCTIKIGEEISLIKNELAAKTIRTTISNDGIVDICSVNSNNGSGVVGEKEGKTTVKVTVIFDNGLYYSKKIIVNVINPNRDLVLIQKKSIMQKGDKFLFITNLSDILDVTWSSSNRKVALINEKTGLVKTVGKGTTIITAMIGEKVVTYKVKVK